MDLHGDPLNVYIPRMYLIGVLREYPINSQEKTYDVPMLLHHPTVHLLCRPQDNLPHHLLRHTLAKRRPTISNDRMCMLVHNLQENPAWHTPVNHLQTTSEALEASPLCLHLPTSTRLLLTLLLYRDPEPQVHPHLTMRRVAPPTCAATPLII